MANLKIKRAPAVTSNDRAWSQVYDDINDIIKSVNKKSESEGRTKGSDGNDGDVRLFKDHNKSKYFIEGKFHDGWAKRELLFSDNDDASQDESINFSSTESYVKPDGSVDFTAPIIGVAPSNNLHLATKLYVDSNATAFELTGNVTGGTSGATAVATTIADNTISQAKMLDNSVGTAEILNDNVTYAKIQNIAGRRFLGRNTNSSGDAEEITTGQAVTLLALESGSADEYLCGNGTFREVSASTSMAGLNDTALISLADGDIMSYENSTSLWKNRTRATIVRPQISASDPIAYNSTSGVISHATGAGKNHIPSGGSSGQFLKYSSSGVATWAAPSYTTSLAWSAITSQPNIQYTSAIGQSELRSTIGYGNQGLVPATGNSGEFLSHNGTFDEISVAVSVAGLSDTAIVSLGTRHFLYYDGSNYWKNTLLQTGDIPNLNASKITAGTLPVSRGGTGTTSGYNNSNWDTAYSDRNKWDGGSSGLTASTGRTSLGLNTGNDVQFDSFGVGTAASGTTGEIRATNEVTAYYSDDRLKDRDKNIENALNKINQLNGFHYSPNALAESLGYDSSEMKVGVSAQEVLKVLPEAVTEAPIDPQYHAVQYDKLIPLIIEAIKELNSKGCGCGSK